MSDTAGAGILTVKKSQASEKLCEEKTSLRKTGEAFASPVLRTFLLETTLVVFL
jgi:hypothetical protein